MVPLLHENVRLLNKLPVTSQQQKWRPEDYNIFKIAEGKKKKATVNLEFYPVKISFKLKREKKLKR